MMCVKYSIQILVLLKYTLIYIPENILLQNGGKGQNLWNENTCYLLFKSVFCDYFFLQNFCLNCKNKYDF